MSIEIRHLAPGDIDWLVEQHGTHYAREEGFDPSFGALVHDILLAFDADHDPTCERAFIAWDGGQRLGSIFCVRLDDETAKLRLFFLTPEARGKGLGKRLLAECMGFARDAGYRRMTLWTHESHRAACVLYASAGWRLVRSKPVHNFGVDLIEQEWDIDLRT
ncbi:GNAT family N-acetyltransferase [Thetidibacter halocola]|nr:GNAT family N-acetyltransferase [Thetidibacter halocola]